MSKVTIATCTMGRITIEHELGIMAQAWPLGHGREYAVMKGYSIQDARNLAVRDAEMHESDLLMFYDDDMIPHSPDAVMTLINAIVQNDDIDVIGAVYPRRTEIPEPVVEKEQMTGAFWGWEDGEIHKVWMVGTGFTLYRMSAFDKLDVPTDKIKAADSEEPVDCRRIFEISTTTDDFHFAALAQDAGINQYVHGGVMCDQIGLDGKRWKVSDARVKV